MSKYFFKLSWNGRGFIMIMEPTAPCKHILSPYTSSTPDGVKRSYILFESNRVAYQINGNIEHHASTYSYTHPWPLGWGQIVKTFLLIVVMLHIKLKRIEYRASGKHIFCPYTHTLSPWRGVKRSKHFSEGSHDAYQIKGVHMFWYVDGRMF